MKRTMILAALGLALAGCSSGGETASGGSEHGSSPGHGMAAADCSPSGASVAVVADKLKFDTDCLAAPAGQAFTIRLDNKDAGVPHNVAIFDGNPTDSPDAKVLFRGDIVTGVTETTYDVKALDAGEYHFHCDVHPDDMNGAFVVK